MTKRLTAQDWIEFGLKTLARDGLEALKADVLARKLGVSRGSFYWHFSDLGAFHARVIEHWKQAATEAIIADLAGYQSPEERLEVLLLRAFGHYSVVEIRLRAWADQSAEAARAIRDVDRRRRDYIERLLAEAGIAPEAAATRAQLLYWAYLGAALSRNKLTGEALAQMVGELKRIGFGARTAGHGAARRRHA
ncbi:TetR/AcrR family transcriptional regulator [Hyphomicrobium sp. CS1BSMeth3]|uniref:TetR/AcrR family transcriptional regulator n=1 Tax=Hyphomicrobium sp. CS1BSMeth3 TaxID=1892844 RepID=UPI00093191A6|nr:TetR/AcrR family transcriptional regulator [Hyphomicrobium sp. CS1BSMeth3]